MRLFFRLAWRNLWRHRRRTVIVILAIGLTIGMMMWYDGLMAGFEDAIYGNAIKVLGAPPGSIELIDAESLKEWFISPAAGA